MSAITNSTDTTAPAWFLQYVDAIGEQFAMQTDYIDSRLAAQNLHLENRITESVAESRSIMVELMDHQTAVILEAVDGMIQRALSPTEQTVKNHEQRLCTLEAA